MKNIELLNICYKFFNRFIVASELIKKLSDIDKTKLSKKDIKGTEELIKEIKKIEKDIPNKVDEYVTKKKESLKRIIERLETIKESDANSEIINKQLKSVKKEYNSEMDSHERWFAIVDCINKNDYFNEQIDSLTDSEFLDFITQYIKAPFPPTIDQEQFDKLVKVGIEKDDREALWRLAFNYEKKNINFDAIVDYYIDKKDGYYLTELISAVSSSLDIDSIIDKVNDKDLIKYLKDQKGVIEYHMTEKKFNKLISKLD